MANRHHIATRRHTHWKNSFGAGLVLAAAVASAGSPSASATVFTWNGGSGIWSTTVANWTTPSSSAWGQGGDAVIAGASGTLTLGEAISANSISFTSSNNTINLAGFNLTVAGSAALGAGVNEVFANTGALATFSTTTLSNATRLTGALSVTLSSSWSPTAFNDFSGDMLFKPTATGILLVANNTELGTGTIKVDSTLASATLKFGTPDNNTRSVTYTQNIQLTHGASLNSDFAVNGAFEAVLTGVISGGTGGGTGIRMTSGQGNLILAGANTFQGSALITGAQAMLTLANANALGNSSGVTMSGTAETLAVTGGITLANTAAINISADSTLTPGGYGMIESLSGNNTLANNIVWSSTQNKSFGVEAGSTLNLTGILGTAAGSTGAGITKIGYGTMILSAQNKLGQNNGGATGNNATEVHEGTLLLDFSQATWETSSGVQTNIINNSTSTDVSLATNTVSFLYLSGGTLQIKGKSGETDSQLFKNPTNTAVATGNSFTVKAGASAVRVTQNGATSVTVGLGKLYESQRAVGGTVDFTLPTTGSILLQSTGTAGIGSNNTILTANGAAFMTVDGNDWAGLGTSRNILAGTNITGFYTANTASALTGNADMSGGTDTTLTGAANLTSLRFNAAAARTITATGQIITTGGILNSSNVGNNQSLITGGTVRGNISATTTLQDLVIVQSNASTLNNGTDNNTTRALKIDAAITDASNAAATGLTVTGPGTVILTSASNSYTGETHINGGMIKLEGSAVIGAGRIILQNGGQLGLPGGSTFTRTLGTGAGNIQFAGSGGFAAYGGDVNITFGNSAATDFQLGQNAITDTALVPSGSVLILGALDATGKVIINNKIALRSPNAPQIEEIRVNDGSAAVDAQISFSTAASRDGSWRKTGDGTVELAGTGAAYTGQTIIDAGTVRWIVATAMPDTALTIHAGVLDLNGNNYTQSHALTLGGGAAGTTSTLMTGAGILTLGTDAVYNGNVANDNGATISGNLALSGTRTFTVNDSTAVVNDLTVSAAITGSAVGITKAGAGTMLLSGTDLYNGATTVSAGKLVVNGGAGGSIANSAVTVQNNATLGGIGNLGGLSMLSGGHGAPGNSVGQQSTPTLSLASGAKLDYDFSTPAASNATPGSTSSDRYVVSAGASAITIPSSGVLLNLMTGAGSIGAGSYELISYTDANPIANFIATSGTITSGVATTGGTGSIVLGTGWTGLLNTLTSYKITNDTANSGIFLEFLGATGNNSTLFVGGSAAGNGSSTDNTSAIFGRVMKSGASLVASSTLHKNGTDSATYNVTTSGAPVSSTSAGTGITYTSNPGINVTLDVSTTGIKTGSVTIHNAATDSAGTGQGSADADDVINVSATALQNRVITSGTESSPVLLGNLLKGAAPIALAGNFTLATTGDNDNNTAITVANNAGSDANGITVSGGNTSLVFNSAAVTNVRTVGGTFTTTGATGPVNGTLTLTPGIEAGVSGTQTPVPVVVHYLVNVGNALADNTGVRTAFGTPLVAFVAQNTSYAGLASTPGGTGSLQTSATILDGSSSSLAGNTVSMAWRTRMTDELPPSSSVVVGGTDFKGLISDVVELTGMQQTGQAHLTDTFVLQMEYVGPTGDVEATRAQIDAIHMVTWDGSNWVLASTGDSTAGSLAGYHDETYAQFLAENGGVLTADMLGAYGIDTTNQADGTDGVVWAVLDHNSDFAAVEIPEPASLTLLGLGAVGMMARRRRR